MRNRWWRCGILICGAALSAGAARAQASATWRLTQEIRIGGAGRGPHYEFTRIANILPFPDGTIVAQELRPLELRQFDATGTYVRDIGRVGDGPGEFRMLAYAGVLADTLWIFDRVLRRLSLFAATGRVLATIPLALPDPKQLAAQAFEGVDIWAFLARNEAIGRASYGASAQAAGRVPAWPVLRTLRDGRTLDTIAWVSTAHSQMQFSTPTLRAFPTQPFSDTPIAVAAPAVECVYVVNRFAAAAAPNATFGVIALRANGDTAWVRRYPYVPKPVTEAVVDSAITALLTRSVVRQWVGRDEVRAQLFLPAFRPPVASALASADGALWLRREDGPGDVDYTVIDAKGNRVASLTLKRNATILAVSGDLVWVVEVDKDDVPSIVRYRITR